MGGGFKIIIEISLYKKKFIGVGGERICVVESKI